MNKTTLLIIWCVKLFGVGWVWSKRGNCIQLDDVCARGRGKAEWRTTP